MKRADIIANVSFACPICKNSFKEAADALQCRNSHVAPTEIVESKFGSRELPDIIAVKFPGGYDSGELANGAVISDKIGALAVIEGKIASNAVTRISDKIGALAVIEGKIASNAVTGNKIKDNAVTTDKIGALAVIEGKIASNAVTSFKWQCCRVIRNPL